MLPILYRLRARIPGSQQWGTYGNSSNLSEITALSKNISSELEFEIITDTPKLVSILDYNGIKRGSLELYDYEVTWSEISQDPHTKIVYLME